MIRLMVGYMEELVYGYDEVRLKNRGRNTRLNTHLLCIKQLIVLNVTYTYKTNERTCAEADASCIGYAQGEEGYGVVYRESFAKRY